MSMFVHTSALCPCTLVHCSTGSLIACNVINISTVCKTTNIVHAKLYYKKFPPVFCFHLWLRIYSTCKILTLSFNKKWDSEDLLPPHLESSWSNPIEWSFHFQCFPQQKPVIIRFDILIHHTLNLIHLASFLKICKTLFSLGISRIMIILTSNYFTAAKPKVAQTTIYSTCTIFYYIHFLHEYMCTGIQLYDNK